MNVIFCWSANTRVLLWIYIRNFSTSAVSNLKSSFTHCLTGLKCEFSFSSTGYHTKAKETKLPNCTSIFPCVGAHRRTSLIKSSLFSIRAHIFFVLYGGFGRWKVSGRRDAVFFFGVLLGFLQNSSQNPGVVVFNFSSECLVFKSYNNTLLWIWQQHGGIPIRIFLSEK